MSATLKAGPGGLPVLSLADLSGASATISLDGAHVTSWIPAGGSEALFVSRDAKFEPGAAIRGGVPVVFPQFAGMGPLPKHGFARTQRWEWASDLAAAPGSTGVTLRLRDSSATRDLWPHSFEAELRVAVAGRRLELRLAVRNLDAEAFSFTAALHTYLRVADVQQTVVEGLADVHYREGASSSVQRERELMISGPIDRIYLDVPGEILVRDPANTRRFALRGQGMRDAVVWNPWQAGAAALPDMRAEEYREMLCVEAAQVGAPVELAPGDVWEGAQQIEVLPE